jgi:chaperonin GroEL (HSP60 family)
MLHKTTWANKNIINKSFLTTAENLDFLYKKVEKALSQQLYSLNKDTYHFIINLLQPKDRLERAYCSHIFNIAYQTEMLSQGAGPNSFVFANAFSKFLLAGQDINGNSTQIVEGYQYIVDKIFGLAQNLSHPASTDDIKKSILMAVGYDEVLCDVIWEAVNLAGLEGKVYIENGKQENYLIEQKLGYSFKVNPYRFFLKQNDKWEATNCKVILIDGVIEDTSEIEHLLIKSCESRIPFVIVAQGFSEEIVATMKANEERGNFDCIPIRVMPDLESINIISDIAKTCNTTPITSLKGDRLCFVNYDEIPIVDKIRCNRNELTIENKSSGLAVAAQLRYLVEKRQNEVVDDIVNLLDKRLRSLVANTVVIHLPNMPVNQIDDVRIKLDNGLRAVKTVLNHGILDLGVLLSNMEKGDTDVSGAVYEAIKRLGAEKKELPTLSLLATLHIVGKTMLLLLSSNGMIHYC